MCQQDGCRRTRWWFVVGWTALTLAPCARWRRRTAADRHVTRPAPTSLGRPKTNLPTSYKPHTTTLRLPVLGSPTTNLPTSYKPHTTTLRLSILGRSTTNLPTSYKPHTTTLRLSILVTEHWAQSWSRCTGSHPPGGRLPLLSARPAVTSPATEHHCPLAGTKLYCLVTEAHRCELYFTYLPFGSNRIWIEYLIQP